MRLPAFTAELSLSKSANHYRTSPLSTEAFVAPATAYTVRGALARSGTACSCSPPPNGCCQGDSQGDPCWCCWFGNHKRCVYF
jgi:hypothetical protein